MAEDSPRPIPRDFLSPALILLGLALVALWPGDVSWLLDEPRLIATAWHLNQDGQIAMGGLYGNFGIRYGPLPTQIYQLLLLVTHDPFTLVVLRSVLCAGVSGFGLLWLGRSLALPGWFAAGVLVSPYVVAYDRVLWDASFAMPVGVLALAAFADFLRTRRRWSLCTCVLASVLAVTIHPQALPLTAAILGWLGWQHRAALWRERRALGVTGLVVLLLNGFYFLQFAGQLVARLSGSVQKGYPGGGSHWVSALAPLLGGGCFAVRTIWKSSPVPARPVGCTRPPWRAPPCSILWPGLVFFSQGEPPGNPSSDRPWHPRPDPRRACGNP